MLVLEPELKFGICFAIGIESKIHKKLWDTDQYKTILGEEEEDDEEDDTKLKLKIVGKGEESLAVSAGIIVCDTKVFYMAFLAGIKGLIGSGEIGFSLQINFNKGNIVVDKFYIIKSYYISLFFKIKIEISTGIVDFTFNIYIFDIPLFGILNVKHDILVKMLGKMIYENFILDNRYQLP